MKMNDYEMNVRWSRLTELGQYRRYQSKGSQASTDYGGNEKDESWAFLEKEN